MFNINVDNLIVIQGFLITILLWQQQFKLLGARTMKNWKALIFKITVLVLIGIVMLTG